MRVEVKKFGNILTSRPDGREAGLVIKAYFKPELNERIELDFSGILAIGPAWLDEVLALLRAEYGKDRVVCLPSDNSSVTESLKIIEKHRGGESRAPNDGATFPELCLQSINSIFKDRTHE